MTKSRRLFASTLELLENAFRQLEVRVSPPIRKPWKDSFVFRYADQTIQQAIVQKLARMVSGLHAVDALSERGLFQEQGIVQRALDEIDEDIWFLALGIIRNDITPRHKEYLDYFYAEEFENPNDIMGSHVSRGMMKREKIRAFIYNEPGVDAARAKTVGKIITKAYSGFVHAASPHIMNMYGGLPPRFDVSGELGSLRAAEHERDALNYFYRAVLAMAVTAKAFGDEALFSKMRASEARIDAAMQG